MKTLPMKHQEEGLRRLRAAPGFYALGAEQGTGKTWMLLADAEEQWLRGAIEAVLVIAPKGVHVNWVRREVPAHLGVDHSAVWWASGASAKHQRAVRRVTEAPAGERLLIFTMNVDAVNTKSGLGAAADFLRRYRAMLIVDESQRIKNPAAKRTQRILALGKEAVSRRIASGTLVANSPLDLFAQYEFLSSGLLGTTSFRAFTAEYAELLPPHHPLVCSVRGRPQIVKRDPGGRPLYRNLERLSASMSPHTFRVTKDECLDLPEKIYQTVYFELTPAQQRLYNSLRDEMHYFREDGRVDTFTALTLINKLRQVTSGFIIVDGQVSSLTESAPRIAALREVVEDSQGQVIVWATFREELRQVAHALREHGVVSYHGGTSPADREAAVDAFQSGAARVFVGHPAAAGTGLTLTAARTVVYHSCSFSLEERAQSEDRAHRIGTRHPVVYIDLVATGTVDERVAAALQAKAGVAAEILGGL